MQRKITRGLGLISGLLIMVLASGCFQASGDQLQPTGFVDIATWTLSPSSTPPEPETIIITATIDPFAVAQEVATEEASTDFGTGGVDEVVEPVVDDTIAQFPTTEPLALDDDQMRATAIIQGATATQDFILTSTAQALGIGQPISTPSPTTDPNIVNPAVTATTAPVVAGADCVDEVVVGDNLFRISQRYGLTVGEIAARNAITNINLIYPGDRLTIPGCGTTGYRPLPTSMPTAGSTTGGTTGDTSGGIFITFTPAPGESAPPASTGTCGSHVVAEGESLFQIAIANGTTVAAIASANGIVNADLIDMGMTINIPC